MLSALMRHKLTVTLEGETPEEVLEALADVLTDMKQSPDRLVLGKAFAFSARGDGWCYDVVGSVQGQGEPGDVP